MNKKRSWPRLATHLDFNEDAVLRDAVGGSREEIVRGVSCESEVEEESVFGVGGEVLASSFVFVFFTVFAGNESKRVKTRASRQADARKEFAFKELLPRSERIDAHDCTSV